MCGPTLLYLVRGRYLAPGDGEKWGYDYKKGGYIGGTRSSSLFVLLEVRSTSYSRVSKVSCFYLAFLIISHRSMNTEGAAANDQ